MTFLERYLLNPHWRTIRIVGQAKILGISATTIIVVPLLSRILVKLNEMESTIRQSHPALDALFPIIKLHFELPLSLKLVVGSAFFAFCIASVNAQRRAWLIQLWPEEPGPRQNEINAASKLLLAAILRDFWIVEEREKVFASSPLPNRIARKVRSDEEARIIYLPRVHYKSAPNLERSSQALAHQERRQHFVAAHLRRAEVASKYQLLLAELYGFSVPIGYTFVRQHERGHKKVEVIYRSRSALQSLYTAVEERVPKGRPRWFQFERDVSKLMGRLGHDVQHVAASRRGDHGVDVYATKFAEDQLENWVIQCKCYSSKNKVGPKIVRELIGSLSHYEEHTKGMIVTTSSFTAGAFAEARGARIRLIDGIEFFNLLSGR